VTFQVPDSWGLEGKVAIVTGGGQVNVDSMFLASKHARDSR
jgi:hypothetical protein